MCPPLGLHLQTGTYTYTLKLFSNQFPKYYTYTYTLILVDISIFLMFPWGKGKGQFGATGRRGVSFLLKIPGGGGRGPGGCLLGIFLGGGFSGPKCPSSSCFRSTNVI